MPARRIGIAEMIVGQIHRQFLQQTTKRWCGKRGRRDQGAPIRIRGGILAEGRLAVLDAQQALRRGGDMRASCKVGGGDEDLAQTVEIMTTAIREMQADGSVKFDMSFAANQTQRFETCAAAKQTCQPGFDAALVAFERF